MIFSPYYGMYNLLLRVRIQYLYLATIAGLGLCFLLWWYFFYQPSCMARDEMRCQINSMYDQRDELKKSEKMFAKLSQSIDAIRDHDQKYSEKSFSHITDLATNAGLCMISCRLSSYLQESSGKSQSMSGDFKGSFDQIVSFFELLSSSKYLIEIPRWELARIDTTNFSLRAMFIISCV